MWTVPMIAQAVTYPCAPVTLTINGSQITVVMTCPSPSPTPSPKPTATPTPTPTPTSSPSPTPSPSATPIANALLDPTFLLGITGANAKWTQATGTWALSGSTLQAPGQGAQANYNIISSPVTVAPGEVISASGYIDDTHVASGTGPGTIQLDSGSTGGPIVAEASQIAGKAGTVSLTYTVPSGVSQVWFQFSNHDALVPAGMHESFSAPFLGIVSGAPTPAPTPSPSPVPGAALPASYCIGGSLYTLGWFDNFAAPGETLSVSDTWPPAAGTKWSNQFYWGRTNNAGLDLALYPSQAQMAALWPTLAPVATIIPGVGLDLHSEPVPTPTTVAQHTALCSNGGDTTCRTYLSGMLGNAVSATTGFWVAREQLAPNNATGESWWDSSWLFNNTPGVGNANELDNPEQWPAAVLGANVVQQTEQCYTPCTAGSVVGYRGVLPTSQTAMNTFESLVTSTYQGVYINNVPTSSQMRLNSTGPLAWLLTAQVNGAYGVTPGPGATADYLIQSVAYYAPSTTPCSGGLATPSP